MVKFFINHPIFAGVIAILMVLIGTICIIVLPVAQYPNIVPPQVQVSSQFVGASSQVVADTVTTPLEQQINGVQGMIYMSSTSTNSGNSIITITFNIGYDLDIAAVDVLNSTTTASALLPPIVTKSGVNIKKVSTNMVLVVNLISPDNSLNESFLGNYADINISDVLSRIPGVGNVVNFGLLRYAIRIWLDPNKMTSMGVSTSDITDAINDQNIQAAVGQIGQPPVKSNVPFQYQVNTLGQLSEVDQFKDIIVKTNSNGSVVRIKDIGTVELGAQDYSTSSQFSGKPTASLGVYQLPGSNAIQVSEAVHAAMEKLSTHFPKGMSYTIAYDTTDFVKASLTEVVVTLFEAILLVFLVVFVFLQNWRTTLIPGIAIPVSLIGTFALFSIFGFSINTLSLLGLVLAIGLVVDDAIVVVENVERKLESGITNVKEATELATKEVQGPIIATTLILMAVFVPVAFIPGMTGQLYNQFALAIAFSVALSGINSLTLSPALCGILLKKPTENKFFLFRWFEIGYHYLNSHYKTIVGKCVEHGRWFLLLFVLLGGIAAVIFYYLPTGFLPEEDQGYFIVNITGPDAASLDRTEAIMDQVNKIVEKTPGVAHIISINGYNLISGINQPNSGVAFVTLKPWSERTTPELQVQGIMQKVQKQFNQINNAQVIAFNAPSIPGLSATAGFQMEVEDLSNQGVDALAAAVKSLMSAATQQPSLAGLFTTYSVDVPQLYLDIDRTKARTLNVPIDSIMNTLQVFLGSLYINNYNKYNQVYQVIIQAKSDSRAQVDDINKLYVKSATGSMVPLSALVTIKHITGPYEVPHYNLYNSAMISGGPAPGYSSGQAISTIEKLAADVLPDGMGYEWTGTTYQQLQAGNIAPLIFMLCLVFVFLFLAALYESWSMPLMIILAVPLALLGAGVALLIRGLALDVYAQIGLIILIGLAAKNAILIVQFAKENREHGMSIVQSVVEAATTRLRPILMTAFAFIFGVLPLAIATGAGAASRHSIGTTVMGGMIAATFLSLILVPVFYVTIEKIREKKLLKKNNQDLLK